MIDDEQQAQKPMHCPDCFGSEIQGYKRGVRCATCNGTGEVEQQAQSAEVDQLKAALEKARDALDEIGDLNKGIRLSPAITQIIRNTLAAIDAVMNDKP
jgi:uncharacterized Zn finger protein (UPF0148 family)